LDAGAAEVRVWNRTSARAQALCAELGGTPVDAVAPADLLVNCTSVGMRGVGGGLERLPVDADRLDEFGCVVDLVYGPGETDLIRAARALSIPAVDGLQLLIGQGALSFERFTCCRAPVAVMRAAAGR
jgi:shikimate dehydrogenase